MIVYVSILNVKSVLSQNQKPTFTHVFHYKHFRTQVQIFVPDFVLKVTKN